MSKSEQCFLALQGVVSALMVALIAYTSIDSYIHYEKPVSDDFEKDLSEASLIHIKENFATSLACVPLRAGNRSNEHFNEIGPDAVYTYLAGWSGKYSRGLYEGVDGNMHDKYTEEEALERHKSIVEGAYAIKAANLSFCFDAALQAHDYVGNYNLGAAYYPDQRLITVNPDVFTDAQLVVILSEMLRFAMDNLDTQQPYVLAAQASAEQTRRVGKGQVRPGYWTPLGSYNIEPRDEEVLPLPPLWGIEG